MQHFADLLSRLQNFESPANLDSPNNNNNKAMALPTVLLVLLGAHLAAAASPSPPARTMTFWATATNTCSDPVSRRSTNCAACCAVAPTDPRRSYCCSARNSTPGSADWEDRLRVLEAHKANLTGLIPCVHAIGPCESQQD